MNNQSIIKKSMMIIMTLVMLLSIAAPAAAQEDTAAPGGNVTTAPSQGPTDRAELEAFLDELIGKEMDEHHIAGAAVSVVKDGKLFFAKGYGYTDLDNKIPVDAEQTIFRIGSITKLFTWTAVMQLVEQGKLDLDADINTYLDFRIPDTFPQPITLKHLMTHTSGFEDRLFGSVVVDAKDEVPVREWLISHMSKRVLPPGDYVGYANYNAVLAGYIVARVSGQPYEQYIQEHLLDPLGMLHSTVRWPIPPDLRPSASIGYTYIDGAFQAFPDYMTQPAGLPSGGLQTSVTDMAHFMIAHLQGGRYSDANTPEARILKEATAQQMHTTLYTPDPRLLGGAYGFGDWSDNGQRTLGHGGYIPPMNSLLLLLPDQNLGVFVNYNSSGGGELTEQHSGFQRAFFDHYYPTPPVAQIQPPADFAQRAGRFVGSYRFSSSPSSTLLKIAKLAGGYTIEIRDPGDGTLLFPLGGRELRFVEVEPLYFHQVDGPFSAIFREDGRGRIISMNTDFIPHYAAIKLGWYETSGFNMALLLAFVLIFLSIIPVSLIGLIRYLRRNSNRNPASRGAGAAIWIILGISILNLLVVGAVWVAMWGMTNELLDPPLILKIVLGLGVLSPVLTAGALVYTVLAWKNSYWGIAARTYYTLMTVAAVAFVWFMNYWNMLGWRF